MLFNIKRKTFYFFLVLFMNILFCGSKEFRVSEIVYESANEETETQSQEPSLLNETSAVSDLHRRQLENDNQTLVLDSDIREGDNSKQANVDDQETSTDEDTSQNDTESSGAGNDTETFGTMMLDTMKNISVLNMTYQIAKADSFSKYIKANDTMWTFFAPNDEAWDKIALNYPSVLRRVFTVEYFGTRLLERHLVMSEVPKTSDILLENELMTLPSLRDFLDAEFIEIPNSTEILMKWRGEEINITQPDIECANGVIHIINRPLLLPGDLPAGEDSSAAIMHIINRIINIISILIFFLYIIY